MTSSANGSRGIPVLMYHDLAESLEGVPDGHRPYVLLARDFADQMAVLASLDLEGTTLSAQLGAEPSRGGRGRAPCVLTFDDGHESCFTHALPILREHGFRATFFVTSSWIGKRPYMDWTQLEALVEAGMEIGSHTVTHTPPAQLGAAEMLWEMAESRRILEERLGIRVRTGSSPTGFFNPGLAAAARQAGYHGLCCGRIALWPGPGAPFDVPRLPVKSGVPRTGFALLASGNTRHVARLRRRQVVRDALKRSLGVGGYQRLRTAALGLLRTGR